MELMSKFILVKIIRYDDIDFAEPDKTDQCNLKEKIGLSEKIRKLYPDQLARLIEYIQGNAKEILDSLEDQDKLLIKIEAINRRSYDHITL